MSHLDKNIFPKELSNRWDSTFSLRSGAGPRWGGWDSVDNFMNNYRKKLKFQNTPGVRTRSFTHQCFCKIKNESPSAYSSRFWQWVAAIILKNIFPRGYRTVGTPLFRYNLRLHQDPDVGEGPRYGIQDNIEI